MQKSFFLFFVFFSLMACRDKNINQNIPYVHVDISLQLSLPSYSSLMIPGNSIFITGGSNGIVIYALSNEDFVAFDRHCTYDVDAYHRITIDEFSNTTGTDVDGCGSQFSIISGDVLKNPASFPLKQYSTDYSVDSHVLRIYN